MSDKKDLNEFAPAAAVPVAATAARFGAGQMIKTGALAAGAAAAFSPKVRRFTSHALGLDKTPEQSTASLNKAGEKLGVTTPASSTPSSGGSASNPTNKPEAPKPAAADKPVSVKHTKGGDYNVYAKGSEKAADFRKAYADAKGNFEWEGRKYAKPSSEPSEPVKVKTTSEPASSSTDTSKFTKPEYESGKKKKMTEEIISEIVSKTELEKSGLTLGQYLNKQRGLTAVKGGANDPSSAKFKGPTSSTAAGQLNRSSSTMRTLPNQIAGRNQTKDASAASLSDRGIRSYSGGNIDTSKFNAPGGNRSTTLPTKSDTPSDLKPVSGDQNTDLKVNSTLSAPGHSDLTLDTFKRPEIVANYNKSTNIPPESESGGKKKKMSEETNPLIAAFLKLQETKAANIFEAAKKAKKSNDGNLANNYPPYDKVTRGDVIAGRLGKDEMGGKLKEGTAEAETSMSVTKDNKPSTPAQTNASTSGPSASDKAALTSKIKSVKEEGGFIRSLFTGGNADQKKPEQKQPEKKEEPSFLQKMNPYYRAGQAFDKVLNKEETQIEEVEFSQAEIDHINSFFEAVAPSRAEPTKGVNPSVSDISLTDDTLQEGRPRKNPTPETSERDARQHIQVIAGRAAAGSTIDFPHNDGSKSKITPAMGRKITSHLQGLKPAERQAAVNKMHASAEGLKV